MPLKTNVGVSRKISDNSYGSCGASVNMEVELDSSLIQAPEQLLERIRQIFRLAKQGVDEELARHQPNNGAASHATNGAINGNGNGHAASNGNGHATNGNQTNGARRNGQAMPVSEKQLNFAKQLAKSIQGLGIRRLEDLAQKLYGKPLAALTTIDGSGLIDTLKSIKAGEINVEQALGGAA